MQAQKKTEKAKSAARVSTSDPQARVMKQSDGGLALSYNAQISADAEHGLIVGVGAPSGGRWWLHHAGQYREDGRTEDRFSGEHEVGKCAQRSDDPQPSSAECVPLSAGDHIAYATGTPSLTLFWRSDPYLSGPAGHPDRHRVLYRGELCRACQDGLCVYPDCAKTISVEEVLVGARAELAAAGVTEEGA